MFVHVAYGGICVGNFGNLPEALVGIPFDYRAHGAGRVVRRRLAVKLSVEVVGIGGVCNHHGAVGCGPFGRNQAGTGVRARKGSGQSQDGRGASPEN